MVCARDVVEEYVLPTLLGSRRAVVASDSPVKEAPRRRRPALAELVVDEESEESDVSALNVKNTFIHGEAELSPSLGAFYRERAVHTCPSRHAGRLADFAPWGSEPAASLPPPPTPLQAQFEIQTPTCERMYDHQAFQIAQQILPGTIPCMQVWGAALVSGPEARWPGLVQELAGQCANAAGAPCEKPRQVLRLASIFGEEELSLPAPPKSGFDFMESAQVRATDRAECAAQARCMPPPPSDPAPGSAELPSLGSARHALGSCTPCAFLHTKGCQNGFTCAFCHLCGPEEKKRRRKENLEQRRAAHQARAARRSR